MTPTNTRSAAQRKAKRTRNGRKVKQRHLLEGVKKRAVAEAVVTVPDVNPVDALQHVLDRAYALLNHAEIEVEKLEGDELWRDTIAGKLPHEWIRFERDMRSEVAYLSGRMVQLDIEGKKVDAANKLGEVLVTIVSQSLEELGLDPKDEKVRKVVGGHLRLAAGGAS